MNISVSPFLAFAAGLFSFVSPCVLPLVPAYVGYLGSHAAPPLSTPTGVGISLLGADGLLFRRWLVSLCRTDAGGNPDAGAERGDGRIGSVASARLLDGSGNSLPVHRAGHRSGIRASAPGTTADARGDHCQWPVPRRPGGAAFLQSHGLVEPVATTIRPGHLEEARQAPRSIRQTADVKTGQIPLVGERSV